MSRLSRMLYCEMWRRVICLMATSNVEDLAASIFRINSSMEREDFFFIDFLHLHHVSNSFSNFFYNAFNRDKYFLRNVSKNAPVNSTSYPITLIFIYDAVKTSNHLTLHSSESYELRVYSTSWTFHSLVVTKHIICAWSVCMRFSRILRTNNDFSLSKNLGICALF